MNSRFGVFAACLSLSLVAAPAIAADQPEVTATEIKIGGIFPFSGPASSIGLVGKGVIAYTQFINDRGGINGRKINYIAMDDAYSPPKALEHARKLVESDEISFMFSQLGTPGISATAKYLTTKGIPSIAIVSGSSKFTVVADYPLTTTGLVSYQIEGRIYAKYDALFIAGTPKFAAQAIRKVAELGWKTQIVLEFPSGSIGGTLKPAGLENSIGAIFGATGKDPTDPKWENDEGVKAYKAFFDKYLPGADYQNGSYLTGYVQGMILEQILRQCEGDFSRSNILKQAKSLKNFSVPIGFSGIVADTSESSNMIWTQLQLQRWNGRVWEQFGGILDDKSE